MTDDELAQLADLDRRALAGELMQPYEWDRLRALRQLRITIAVAQIADAFQRLSQSITTTLADLTLPVPEPLALTTLTPEEQEATS